MADKTPPDTATSDKQQRIETLISYLTARLDLVFGNLRMIQGMREPRLSFADSIVAARQAAGAPKRRRFGRKRFDVEVELVINHHALSNARRRGGDNAEIEPEDIVAARTQMLSEIKVPRGARSDPKLEFHLHAAMALIYEVTGHHVIASLTRDSVYRPHVKPEWAGRLLHRYFREAGERLTMTRLTNLIDKANKSGALADKRFRDFFPLDFARAVSSNDSPPLLAGYELQQLAPPIPIPIYSS